MTKPSSSSAQPGPNPPASLADHVAGLCAQYRVTHEVGGTRALAEPKERRITTPRPVTRIRSYYIALHEIAHVVQGFDSKKARAPQEAAAWTWAIDNAIVPPSDGVRRHIFQVVWGYVVSDGNRHFQGYGAKGRMIPAREDPFWQFLSDQLVGDPAEALYQAAKVASARIDPILAETLLAS
jgi:hypothetical protein